MLAFEKRWADSVLGGFAPVGGPGLAPRAGEVDYGAALERMAAASTRLAALGVHLSLWLVFFAPLWLEKRLRTLRGMPPKERAALLDRLLGHRLHIVRELTLVLKLAACMALFRTPSMRARSNYDRPASWEPEDVERSGERARVRLAVVPTDDVEVA